MHNKISLDPAIETLLKEYVSGVTTLLGENVVGVYLFGSLTYSDFDPKRSDIDLMVVVKEPLLDSEVESVEQVHRAIEVSFPQWQQRIEASYTPLAMLREVLPPQQPRPYYGEGKMWPEAQYGNEWIINLYFLKEHGLTLYGSKIDELIDTIDLTEVQKASVRDLFAEWEPKLRDPSWLDDSHYQSYLVLNLCRILQVVMNATPLSKTESARWAKTAYPQWKKLIEAAQNWSYGGEMNRQSEALEFLQFTIAQVRKHELFNQTPTETTA